MTIGTLGQAEMTLSKIHSRIVVLDDKDGYGSKYFGVKIPSETNREPNPARVMIIIELISTPADLL